MSQPKIHSKTLFHFTNQAGLIGILQSNFRASFVKERMSQQNGRNWDYWVPMLCFCDIPLHLISDHINQYGQYGLGLSREWALRSKLNPVFYYQPSSLLFDEFDSMMTLQHEDHSGLIKEGMLIKSTHNIYLKTRYLLQYFKPWFGYDFKLNKERRFYDEREWRYVPLAEGCFESIYNDDNEFASKKDEYYKKLRVPNLVFAPKDINYIVLHEESERYDIVQRIREIKGKYSYRDVETLISKVITVEQIEDDI
ncbi:MAG TPA: abortive infection system antitoxin AbiGi family protein [Candidatus Wunengus sp. YC63]|uniref:abortive infection system antitoxin AbiGi family protein n=1 Tax=Candidatus Wunengus sp. YC63 TaxID=3367699 RepID=UPI002712EA33|nr:abortive infection system antitoxin AbiGi family protein [Candidatus Brocadiales bacterium]